MGAPGPPGPFDLHKFFRGPSQNPYPPQSAGYQPSSPGNSFHLQPSHSSYPPGNVTPNNFPPNTSGYTNVHGSTYPYNTTPSQQSGSPVYHGPQYMPYNQDHGPRQVPYSSSPFSQQPSQFSQPPSSPSHSVQPPSPLPMSSIPMSSQPMFPQPKSSQPIPPLPMSSLPQGSDRSSALNSQLLDGARLMALLTTQSGGEGVDDEETLPIPGAPQSSPRLPLSSLRHADVSHSSGVGSGPPPLMSPALPPPVNLVHSSAPGRPPPKISRGRHLRGEHIVYDVDVRKPGEAQLQLEVSPITVYGSEPVLVLGRQIAVNKKFVCYGLRGGAIRILNISREKKALLRGHTQRVTDMAFFSENAHLLASASQDGRIYVRKIVEGSGEDGKLTDHILLALQFGGDWETCHPRLCWHSNLQDFVVVAIGKFVVTIDVSKAGQGAASGGFNADQPLECYLETPVRGVYVAGQHDEDVTELAVPLSGSARLASASKDGTVRIWGEKKQSLSVVVPYDGNTVDAVAFLSPPRNADQHVLLTAGPLNRELKLWAFDEPSSKSGQGVWRCIQTLEFQSNSKPEGAFYNQVVVAPRAGLILLANAKRNAIYVIHVEFGPASVAPRMDYLVEFAVTMPILSLTVTEEAVTEAGEGSIKVFCLQTQAIQQYNLDLSQCLPPPIEDLHLEGSTPNTPKKGLGVTQAPVTSSSASVTALEKGYPNVMTLASTTATSLISNPGIPPRPSAFGSLVELGSRGQMTEASKLTTVIPSRDPRDGAGKPTTPGTHPTFEAGVQSGNRLNTRSEVTREGLLSPSLAKPPTPPPKRRPRSGSPAKAAEVQHIPVYTGPSRHKVEKVEEVKDIWLESEATAAAAPPPPPPMDSSSSSNSIEDDDNEEREVGSTASSANPTNFQQQSGQQLISPADIMSLAVGSKQEGAPIQGAGLDLVDEVDWQEDTRSGLMLGGRKPRNVISNKDNVAGRSEALLLEQEDVGDPSVSLGSFDGQGGTSTNFIEKEMMTQNDSGPTSGLELPGLSTSDDVQDGDFMEDREQPTPDDLQDELKGMALKLAQAVAGVPAVQSQTSAAVKGRKSKNKNGGASASIPLPTSSQLPIVHSPASGAAVSEGETGSSPTPAPLETGLIAQVASIRQSLNQLVTIQKELQKQMTVMVAVPVVKEGKRIEAALGQRMDKVLKANVDAVWARIAEESAKKEKQERERVQQVMTLLNNFISKDIPVALERGLKKEAAAIGPAVAQAILPPLQKAVSTAVIETFQKSVIEKVLPQLEKAAVSKLEATMTKQLKTQFQTAGRQALQEALRAGFESLVIPAFERSCRAMFEQVDSTFQMGMAEHTSHAQQQFASSHTALATNLQEAIAGASSLAKALNDELLDSTAKLVELLEIAGANVSRNGEVNQSKGGLPEKVHSLQHVEQSLDPTIELGRLLQEGKMEEAFNKALMAGDLQVVSWLCHQLNPATLLSAVPLPVSQGVLLSLVQQLSSDLPNDTGHKLQWIKEAALALNPNDPQLGPHMRLFLEQSYQNLHHLMSVTKVQSEQATLRLVIHVINSLLSSCK